MVEQHHQRVEGIAVQADDHAGEDHFQRIQPLTGDQQIEHQRGQRRTRQRQIGQADHQQAGEHNHAGGHGEIGTGGNAERRGFGQRIAQYLLKKQARHRQRHSCQHADRQTR